MDFDAIRGGLQDAVPFNAHLGVDIAEVGPGVGVAKLPDRSELRNHTGSQHASALFAAGQAASGAALVGALGERLGDFSGAVDDAQIHYLAVPQGTITARATLDRDAEALRKSFDEDGNISFEASVELTNAHGDTVAEMTVSWTVQRAG